VQERYRDGLKDSVLVEWDSFLVEWDSFLVEWDSVLVKWDYLRSKPVLLGVSGMETPEKQAGTHAIPSPPDIQM